MNKEPLLYLCHRIPYPPNKGDKIRSFNILKKLSEQYDVYLACFIDDPFDKQYVDELNKYCVDVCAIDQSKLLAKIKGLKAFLTGQAITLPYYADNKLKHWVNRVFHQKQIENIFIYSSSMAQYCEGDDFAEAIRVIDFVDIDSDKWRQYAEKKSGIARWVFEREYRKLAHYEQKIAKNFDHSLFVSPDEAALFQTLQPEEVHRKIHGMLNGVDVDFFNPKADMANENIPQAPFISFTGAMDYWANVDSVIWFTKYIWPNIHQENPDCQFLIVGGNPSAEVQQLAKLPGVVVSGRVHDIRPYIVHAKCVVAPMQIARGIQNKVLEAMSLNKPIVTTTMGMEGINAPANEHVVITDDAERFTQACLALLNNGNDCSNRQWIIDNFTWQATLAYLTHYFKTDDVEGK